jgi:nucleoside-diphosphate-sugar epimerase
MSERDPDSQTVAVTGATGFLGQALCQRLMSMHIRVRAAARTPREGPWSDFVPLDLPHSVPAELFTGVDVVFHLAGKAHAVVERAADAIAYDEVNREGTLEVAQRAKALGVRRFVFMSTVKALGEAGEGLVPEDRASIATDPYGRSKYEAEVSLMNLHTASFQVVILRPALVYGPGAKGNFESLMRLLRRGRRPPLPIIRNRRSLVGLNDLIAATILVGTHPAASGRAYTVTDGQVYSTTDIIDILSDAFGVTRRAPFTVPLPALRSAARLGDLAGRVTGRRAPFDSATLHQLLGNAEYEAGALTGATGFTPAESLHDLADSMSRPPRGQEPRHDLTTTEAGRAL